MSSSGRRRDLLQLVFAVVVPEGLQGQVDLVELTPLASKVVKNSIYWYLVIANKYYTNINISY